MPECNIASDIFGCRHGVGIVPGGIAIGRALNHHVIVARLALPEAVGMCGALAQVLAIDRLRREVIVALDDDPLIAPCKLSAVPPRDQGSTG